MNSTYGLTDDLQIDNTRCEQLRNNAVDIFSDILSFADDNSNRTLHVFENKLWDKMLKLGRALVALYLFRQVSRPRLVEYSYNGFIWRLCGKTKASEIGTKFGKVEFIRFIARRLNNKRAACDLPIDRELGLCGGMSLGVTVTITKLCAQMAFAIARQNFLDTYKWVPAPKSIMRMIDAVGAEARGFLEQADAPAQDGDIIVIQVDGKGARRITPEAYRRRCQRHQETHGKKGEKKPRRNRKKTWLEKRKKKSKSKNAKQAVIGAIYTIRVTGNETEGPIEKRLLGTFNGHEALFKWLRAEADKRGYGQKRTLFLSDGAEAIWRLQKKYFPNAEVCLDWCHVVEKLWKAGEKLYGKKKSKELVDWVENLIKMLSNSDVANVILELQRTRNAISEKGPGNKKKRQRLKKAIDYISKHSERLRYSQLCKEGLEIGTGVIEGAVKNLVGARIDGSGMQWGGPRAELILHLRCILLNGQWDKFIEFLAEKHIKLKPQPIRAVPYRAKAVA